MIELSFVVLHGSHGVAMTSLEYLYRVILSLFAVGGTAVLVFWWLDAIEAFRSAFRTDNGPNQNDE